MALKPILAGGLVQVPAGGGIATTANTLYVDSLGSDATGARGNPSKKFLTLQAAVTASTAGDVILCGSGDFTLTGTGSAWSGVTIHGASTNKTVIHITITDASFASDEISFFDCQLILSLTATNITLPSRWYLYNAVMDCGVTGALDLNSCLFKSYENSAVGFGSDGDGSAGSVTGSATVYGTRESSAIDLTNCASDVEVYLIGCGDIEASLADDAAAKTGQLNAQACYGANLTAATVKAKNTAYTSIVCNNTDWDGGGNRNETVDISAVQAFSAYTLATLPTIVPSGTITVSNATGGQTLCFSDGTNWISVKTGVAVA